MNGPCIACGFPADEARQHGADNPGKDYCRYCSREDGSMKSYQECVDGYTAFVMREKGVDEATARAEVRAGLASMPAWKDLPEARV